MKQTNRQIKNKRQNNKKTMSCYFLAVMLWWDVHTLNVVDNVVGYHVMTTDYKSIASDSTI